MLRSIPFLVMMIFVKTVYAEPKTFDSWVADSNASEGKYFAATVNDSGNLLGQYCFTGTGSCMWLIGAKSSCEKGSTYPILVNADTGAAQLSVTCNGRVNSDLYEYMFTEFAAIDAIIRNAKRVGFAVPLQGDEFMVYRFSLQGSIAALTVMRAIAEGMTKPVVRSTRDQRL